MLTPDQVLLRAANTFRRSILLFTSTLLLLTAFTAYAGHPLVLETDFGLQDGAVSSMKGVFTKLIPNSRLLI